MTFLIFVVALSEVLYMSRPLYLHDLAFCSIVHSYKNLLECLAKASYSVLWFMFIYPFCIVSLFVWGRGSCQSENEITSVVYLFKILTDNLVPGSNRRSAAKTFFSRVESETGSSFAHTNSDSGVNTGLEIVCKAKNIQAPVLYLHSDKLESKLITLNTPDLPALPSVVSVIDLRLVHKTQFCMKSYFHQNKSGDTSGLNAPRSQLNPYQKSEIFSFWNGQNKFSFPLCFWYRSFKFF